MQGEAETFDRSTFYKLVKKQRGTDRSLPSVTFTDPNASQIEGWANYFQTLASPSNLPTFNTEYKDSAEMQRLLLKGYYKSSNDCQPVSVKTVEKHIASLKNGKACDVFGVSAEHIKFASPMVAVAVAHVINKCFERGKLVSQFKTGVITPVHKKGKPLRNPDSYRRITVNSIIGKVLEKELLARTKAILNPQQQSLQFGFTEKCSSTHCALMLTEAVAEVQDTGESLYITFMDAKKAFDVVWHESMLVSLHNSQVTGAMWNIYDNMYTNLISQVKLGGILSMPIEEKQGIRQGGLTSTELFKNRSNPMLKRLAELPDSFRIGCLPIGAPTTADDTALL